MNPTLDEVKAEAAIIEDKIKTAPRWQLFTLLGLVAFLLAYVLWLTFGSVTQTHSQGFVATKHAISTVKVAGPVLKVPMKIIPRKAVRKKFPEAPDLPDDEEYVDDPVIPPAPNGGTVLTKVNETTGEVSSTFEAKAAPWFAFRRDNHIEAFAMVSNNGPHVAVDAVRDIFSVKEAVVAIKAGGRIPLDSSPRNEPEWHAGAGVKYNFQLPGRW
jgi:hypothetical protein